MWKKRALHEQGKTHRKQNHWSIITVDKNWVITSIYSSYSCVLAPQWQYDNVYLFLKIEMDLNNKQMVEDCRKPSRDGERTEGSKEEREREREREGGRERWNESESLRKEFFFFLLTRSVWKTADRLLPRFMHLQNSATLIDTLWNSLLHFHLKERTSFFLFFFFFSPPFLPAQETRKPLQGRRKGGTGLEKIIICFSPCFLNSINENEPTLLCLLWEETEMQQF